MTNIPLELKNDKNILETYKMTIIPLKPIKRKNAPKTYNMI